MSASPPSPTATAVDAHAVKPILPGGVIGVMGDGQLGRMLGLAARRMGYGFVVFGPEADSPASHVADHQIIADYADRDALTRFARSVDVITLEFENVPAQAAMHCATITPVRPGPDVLHLKQDRLREKNWLLQRDLPVPEFRAVSSIDDLRAAARQLGTPLMLKRASWGYDGKGQVRITDPSELNEAWEQIQAPAIAEVLVPFACEISVLVARGLNGNIAIYEPVWNRHRNQILDLSLMPAPVDAAVKTQAVAVAQQVIEALGMVGLLCVEFFVTAEGQVLINELAPRVHNSGHLTIEACVTSQFEQQLRAVCGLPLGHTTLIQPAAMANLLGDVWHWDADGSASSPAARPALPAPPNWAAALTSAAVKLHLYGKAEPRRGRKMGHLTALASDAQVAADLVQAARQAL